MNATTIAARATIFKAGLAFLGSCFAGAAASALALGAADTLIFGGGKVTSPSLVTVMLRRTTSSKFTSIKPSLFLHKSFIRFTKFVE